MGDSHRIRVQTPPSDCQISPQRGQFGGCWLLVKKKHSSDQGGRALWVKGVMYPGGSRSQNDRVARAEHE